jgi:trehalose synthase
MHIENYISVARADTIRQLQQLGHRLRGARVVHVNSTREGGGVAEILQWMIPLMQDIGIEASWEVVEGNEPFFAVTKAFHNALQGNRVNLGAKDYRAYEETNEANADRLRPVLEEADFVFIHDPQPARLLEHCPNRRGKWVWRCHIDAGNPYRPVWKYLAKVVERYDASVFSLPAFAKSLNHPQVIIAPSIDPLSEKNMELSDQEVDKVRADFDLDPKRRLLVQVSRFDRFKDPLGVIRAFHLVRAFAPVQLALAGGGATDDPEGQEVLAEVQAAAEDHPDIHVLSLPNDAHRVINALQRAADIVIQKSLREGFGLTVTEGLWKGRPVIGGDVGGIRLQVVNGHTGFLVHTPEGAAHRIRYLLANPETMWNMGVKGREYVRENFLLTRHLREYLTLMLGLRLGLSDHLETA